MKQTALLIQPGAFGDIITCAPIAKHFSDKGIEVHWAVHEKYKEHLESITSSDVTPIILDELEIPEGADWLRLAAYQCYAMADKFTKVIDLADRHPYATYQFPNEVPEETKYRLLGLPLSIKHTLTWERNIKKEKSLYSEVVGDTEEYVIAALVSSHEDKAEMPKEETRKVIEITPREGYNIVDWFEVIKGAKDVYCVESAIQCFVDGCRSRLPSTQTQYLLKRTCIPKGGKRHTVAKNWNLSYF